MTALATLIRCLFALLALALIASLLLLAALALGAWLAARAIARRHAAAQIGQHP